MEGFISISLRCIINLESLSGIETVGNLSRHRTAPIVVPSQNGYIIKFVPVLSGESLAHYYQKLLLDEAQKLKINVSKRSLLGEFLKFADEKLLSDEGIEPPANENEIRKVEAEIIYKDYISDVGGFMYAGAKGKPVKRTSCFQVGYAIPAIYESEAAALEAQFHVRFSASKLEQQMPYNVEVGSALYTFSFTLNLSRIARVSNLFGVKGPHEDDLEKERSTRVKGALNALLQFYSSLAFGAKRSRFLPNMEPVSAIACYSPNTYFISSPGNSKQFIAMTIERANKFNETAQKLGFNTDIRLACFDKEGAAENLSIQKFNNLEGLIGWLVSQIVK